MGALAAFITGRTPIVLGLGLTLGLLAGCTTSFPLSLIDGGGEDVQTLDGGPDTGQPDVVVVGCGDGLLQAGETCDDGNTAADDGCDSACLLEAGWSCTGEPSACTSVCGDSLVVGDEDCDDGNTVNGDGCNDACEVECANGSVVDCNPPGETLVAPSAFVDPDPPTGFVQCAGFENTNANDVGPDWDANCLGAIQTLRIRYWDTSANPWALLGDATLTPSSDASYVEQIFNATNHAGSEGILESQGVSLLKDDPAAPPPSTWVCNAGHPVQEYGASDLYFGTQTDSDSALVCGWSTGDDAAAPCADGEEIMLTAVGFGSCTNGGYATSLAIALYQQL